MEVRDSGPQPADNAAFPGHAASSTQSPRGATAAARIRLRHLSCFVVVAQERTLARAAARLHLSQPAVSKTLAELEDLAGRRLVERGRAGTQLTPAGEEFLRYAVDVTQALESAAAVLTGAGDRAFCAGVDLHRMGDFYRGIPPDRRREVWDREPGIGGITRNFDVGKPVIVGAPSGDVLLVFTSRHVPMRPRSPLTRV